MSSLQAGGAHNPLDDSRLISIPRDESSNDLRDPFATIATWRVHCAFWLGTPAHQSRRCSKSSTGTAKLGGALIRIERTTAGSCDDRALRGGTMEFKDFTSIHDMLSHTVERFPERTPTARSSTMAPWSRSVGPSSSTRCGGSARASSPSASAKTTRSTSSATPATGGCWPMSQPPPSAR